VKEWVKEWAKSLYQVAPIPLKSISIQSSILTLTFLSIYAIGLGFMHP